MNKNNILIIGAGIAGLTAAIYIQRAGKQAIVFEKMHRVVRSLRPMKSKTIRAWLR